MNAEAKREARRAAVVAACVTWLASAAGAAVFVTTKTADTADGACDRDCSLREAVIAANQAPGPDVVIVSPGIYRLTRTPDGADDPSVGDLDLTGDVVLYGETAATTIVDGNATDRLIDVPAGVTVELIGLTLRGGRALGGGGVRNLGTLSIESSVISGNATTGSGANGGGVWSSGAQSALTVRGTTIANNGATGAGGGLSVDRNLTIVNSTLSGNTAVGFGGGLYVDADIEATIQQSTITNNHGARGGGIYGLSSPFLASHSPRVAGSIVAGNSATIDRDCSGAVASDGDNLLGDGGYCLDFKAAKGDLEGTAANPLQARLGGLEENGGPTPTHALLPDSPAIGHATECEAFDQRGQQRAAQGCDAGAFEVGDDCLDGGRDLCLNQDRFRVAARWRTGQGTSGDAQAVPVTVDSGLFWFFDPANLELTVKVIDGCGLNGHYWVFLSGLTNVEVTLTVSDGANGAEKIYTNPLDRNFRPVFDTGAFSCS